jgi:hypothetical protein
VQILLHARNVGDSDSFLEARAEFSAMEAALRRNRNANLHKLPVECVLKPIRDCTAFLMIGGFFFFLIFLCLGACAESRWEHFTDLAGPTPLVSSSILIDKLL